jgi:hypothetical protein
MVSLSLPPPSSPASQVARGAPRDHAWQRTREQIKAARAAGVTIEQLIVLYPNFKPEWIEQFCRKQKPLVPDA